MGPEQDPRQRLSFGAFELNEPEQTLLHAGRQVSIQPKPLAILFHLARNRERVVSKGELLRAIWPGVSVSDQALWSAVRDLRRALGDIGTLAPTIQTIRGRGFRFAAAVAPAGPPPSVAAGPRAATSGPTMPAARAPFVDREEAMASLRGSLAEAASGQMRVSFIAGPAGIGKTRLAAELADEARSRGFAAHTGRCFDREGAAPFWPWLQVLRSVMSSGDDAANGGRASSEFGWVLPELAGGREAPERADLDRAEVRFRFFDAVALLLQRVSRAQPLLVLLDDLHWADEASLRLLDFVIGAIDRAPLHVIGTFRDPPRPGPTLTHVLATATRLPATEQIDLCGLGRDAIGLLLEQVTRQTPAPSVVDAVLASTAGNPLFVTELAKLAARGEFEVRRTGCPLPVPTRVRDVLRWQVGRLSPDCQLVLQLLSTAAGGLDLPLLARAARMDATALLPRIGEAEAAGLAVASQDGAKRVAFVHDLVRESVYLDLPTATRVALHRRVGQALEALSGTSGTPDMGQIAYHYALAAADSAETALRFCRLAGQQANARMAYEDAVDHYERARQALPLLAAPDLRLAAELLLEQAEAAWGTLEDAALVQKRFEAAAAAARAAGASDLFARAALGRSGHGAGSGDYRDISIVDEVDIALLSEAADALRPAESELRALVLARLALAVRYGREFRVAEVMSGEACRMAEACGGCATLAEALRYRHEVLSGPRFAQERLEIARRMLPLARAIPSRPLELDALIFAMRDSFKLLDHVGAKEAAEAADALAATMRHPGAQFRSGMRVVFLEALRGRLEQAERHAHEFHERDRARNMGAAGTLELQLIMLATLREDHLSMIAALSRMAARYDLAWVDCGLSHAHAGLGHRAHAERYLRAASADDYRRLEDHHSCLGGYLHMTEACAALGDRAGAAQLYRRMLPYERLMATPFLSIIWQGPVAYGLGTLAALLSDDEQARRHFECALEIVEPLRSPPLIAQCRERLGQLLFRQERRRHRARAIALLESAAELAEGTGMMALVRRVTALLDPPS